jgi:CheY-like chemotaxis protein
MSVTDTGVGMDENTRKRIFEPFFTTQKMGQGTGLGLASAYGIIQNHGGILNVYSEKGKGTSFNIYLPVSGKKVEAKERRSDDRILKGTETVLLIDDEDMILDVGQGMLKKLGYKVLTEKNGKKAVEVYKRQKDEITLVILDMIMPDMSGGEVYDKIKEINSKVKVLLSSGYSLNGQAKEILERGCDAFIQKPYGLQDISQIIREVLNKK